MKKCAWCRHDDTDQPLHEYVGLARIAQKCLILAPERGTYFHAECALEIGSTPIFRSSAGLSLEENVK